MAQSLAQSPPRRMCLLTSASCGKRETAQPNSDRFSRPSRLTLAMRHAREHRQEHVLRPELARLQTKRERRLAFRHRLRDARAPCRLRRAGCRTFKCSSTAPDVSPPAIRKRADPGARCKLCRDPPEDRLGQPRRLALAPSRLDAAARLPAGPTSRSPPAPRQAARAPRRPHRAPPVASALSRRSMNRTGRWAANISSCLSVRSAQLPASTTPLPATGGSPARATASRSARVRATASGNRRRLRNCRSSVASPPSIRRSPRDPPRRRGVDDREGFALVAQCASRQSLRAAGRRARLCCASRPTRVLVCR